MIVQTVDWLVHTNPDLMWEILFERAAGDDHDDVLGAVAGTSWRLRSVDRRAVDLVVTVASRANREATWDAAFSRCAEIAGLIWTLDGDPRAGAVVTELAEQSNPSVIGQMLHEIRQAGSLTSDDDGVRLRALNLCATLIERGQREIVGWEDAKESTPEADVARIKAGLELLEQVASQLAFASGFHDAKQNESRPPSDAEIRFASEAATLYERLAAVPNARTTHEIVQSVSFVLDSDPARALHLVHRLVTGGGRGGGYQLETLAVGEIVEIVQRLLADHRAVLQDPNALDALREILEVFVDAGWPQAHQLAFGLEQIFR